METEWNLGRKKTYKISQGHHNWYARRGRSVRLFSISNLLSKPQRTRDLQLESIILFESISLLVITSCDADWQRKLIWDIIALFSRQKYNKRPKWFGKGCTEWLPHSEAELIEPRDRQTDGRTDRLTDTAHIGNNSLHLMHSIQPKNERNTETADVLYSDADKKLVEAVRHTLWTSSPHAHCTGRCDAMRGEWKYSLELDVTHADSLTLATHRIAHRGACWNDV